MREGKLIKTKLLRRPKIVPDYFADNILDIDFARLSELGIKHIIIDLDLTLKKKLQWHVDPRDKKYINDAVKKYSFKSISIATNNMLRIGRYAEALEANVFQPFWVKWKLVRKPSKGYFDKILKQLKAKPRECVIIGDKLKSDVYGGNSAGMLTILVKAKGGDYWYDRVLFTRMREHRVLSKYFKKSSR